MTTGSAWAAARGGANNQVNASVVDASGNLYIGGSFTGVGETKANYIAKWDGNSWSALGSGLNGRGNALALSGSDLYAGGAFTMAGDKAAGYAARAILRLPSLTLRLPTSGTVAVSWPSSSPGFVLQQNTNGVGSGNWSNVTDSILDDGTNNVMTQPIEMSRFFRLVPQ